MTFSLEWESLYSSGQQHTHWPWSDLVSLVFRFGGPIGPGFRVLELGCGTGANAPLFRALGADYYAVDGSREAVAIVHERFPDLRHKVCVGDFTRALPPGSFDLVVDRAAVTHNPTTAIRRTLDLVFDALRPGSAFIGVDWFSDRHSERVSGERADDDHTFTGYSSGNFKGCGRVHFSDESHIRQLFVRFDVCLLTEKTVRDVEADPPNLFASFNVVARKPAR